MEDINFLHCCSNAKRLLVDWEGKGLVELLDMDRIVCVRGDKEEIVEISSCRGCVEAFMEEEEESILYSIWRYNYGQTQTDDYTTHRLEDSEE